MIIDGARFLRRRQSWSIVQVEILAPDNEKDTLSTALRELKIIAPQKSG